MSSNFDRSNPYTAIEHSASMGGPTWIARGASLADEIAHGTRWRRAGVASEVAPLREVLLHVPGEELRLEGPPDRYLMHALPDPKAMAAEVVAVAAFYQAQGVAVQIARPAGAVPPNFVFQRDLFFMTPSGVVLGRPAAEARAGEERFAAEVLGRLGVPILLCPHGQATFEGADALWLNESTVLLGVGRRTNAEAQAQLGWLLMRLGVRVVSIPMPSGVQHLLGLVNFIDRDLAAINAAKAPDELRAVLREQGVELIELEPSQELTWKKALNFVTLRPRVLVMPAGCPNTRKRYEACDVEVHELSVEEHLKAAGALGCLTGILWRG